MSELQGSRIHISGIVQGVGFRPFVYGLAMRLSLTGWVRNTSAGVDIVVDGPREALLAFEKALQDETPPLARIDEFRVEATRPGGFTWFEITHSEAISGAFQPISPDVTLCPDCLNELFDPGDRRYRYSFINCTNCGPRFTIIQDIPYDRAKTTMASFALCPDCAREYEDPRDRRFHAQPVACPVCGPHIWLESVHRAAEIASHLDPVGMRDYFWDDDQVPKPGGFPLGDKALCEAQRLLTEGNIVAVKGLGGFHLACDATNPGAVSELRSRKLRVDKPFALMMPDLETVLQHCFVSPAERALLESRERPIVILHRRPDSTIAEEVAPHQKTVGVMLPYTPLHYLLLAPILSEGPKSLSSPGRPPQVLVMTSGNLSEEPIATSNQEARLRLSSLADAFLMHNRPIYVRCDDSVVRVFEPGPSLSGPGVADSSGLEPGTVGRPASKNPRLMPLRRSRGYAPFPVRLPWEAVPLLAAGAELKNTFCITQNRYAFLSHHIGDLENYETLESFESGAAHFERLFRVRPQALAYDLHPNYLASRYVLDRSEREALPAIGVQHHHAHIAACLAEHGMTGDEPVIGVAFDGTGYGEDGAIWGGEVLLAGYDHSERRAHLAYAPLPGGDAAIRRPARTALAYLWQAGLDWQTGLPCVDDLCVEERVALRSQLEHSLNSPPTSSMGRLFDAAAALIGVRQKVNYEAQAAIELEALVDPSETGLYPFEILPPDGENGPIRIDPAPLLQALSSAVLAGEPVPILAARFHNGVAAMVRDLCRLLRTESGVYTVALSGGVWQNLTLLGKTKSLLDRDGFNVLIHSQAPANDGGIALGQAAVAVCRLMR